MIPRELRRILFIPAGIVGGTFAGMLVGVALVRAICLLSGMTYDAGGCAFASGFLAFAGACGGGAFGVFAKEQAEALDQRAQRGPESIR